MGGGGWWVVRRCHRPQRARPGRILAGVRGSGHGERCGIGNPGRFQFVVAATVVHPLLACVQARSRVLGPSIDVHSVQCRDAPRVPTSRPGSRRRRPLQRCCNDRYQCVNGLRQRRSALVCTCSGLSASAPLKHFVDVCIFQWLILNANANATCSRT